MTKLLGAVAAVLLLVSIASADCGWVLWQFDRMVYMHALQVSAEARGRGRDIEESDYWQKFDGFDTKAQCIAKGEENQDKWREYVLSCEAEKLATKFDKPGTMAHRAALGDIEWRCWPVGVKPWKEK